MTGPRRGAAERYRTRPTNLNQKVLDTMEVFNLSELTSRCRRNDVDAAHRTDPYWDGVWEWASSAQWWNSDLAQRMRRLGQLDVYRNFDQDPQASLDALLGRHDLQERLRYLGAVDSWRTMTNDQARAVSGAKGPTQWAAPDHGRWFASGLLDMGRFPNNMMGRRREAGSRDWLVRPSRTRVFDERVVPRLSFAEWVSVTGGQGWHSGGQYDRHNVLACELGLRAAELLPVGTVLGEKFSSVDLLAGSGLGLPHDPRDRRAADMTVVRPDGLRIAVELTATSSGAFEQKVTAWAKTLARLPLSRSGLVVVFVVAATPSDQVSRGFTARNARKVIARVSRLFPGRVGDRPCDRMMIVDWREWFPGSHQVSDRFFRLECQRPSGPVGDEGGTWEPVSLLGEGGLGFDPVDREGMLDVLVNAQGLAGVPVFLRDRSLAPDLNPVVLARSGWGEVPVHTGSVRFGEAGTFERMLML